VAARLASSTARSSWTGPPSLSERLTRHPAQPAADLAFSSQRQQGRRYGALQQIPSPHPEVGTIRMHALRGHDACKLGEEASLQPWVWAPPPHLCLATGGGGSAGGSRRGQGATNEEGRPVAPPRSSQAAPRVATEGKAHLRLRDSRTAGALLIASIGGVGVLAEILETVTRNVGHRAAPLIPDLKRPSPARPAPPTL
jgi:hypothetical protein